METFWTEFSISHKTSWTGNIVISVAQSASCATRLRTAIDGLRSLSMTCAALDSRTPQLAPYQRHTGPHIGPQTPHSTPQKLSYCQIKYIINVFFWLNIELLPMKAITSSLLVANRTKPSKTLILCKSLLNKTKLLHTFGSLLGKHVRNQSLSAIKGFHFARHIYIRNAV